MVCYRYIEANPLRARMVGQAGDYPWSSYGANAEGRSDSLLTEHKVYLALGSSPQARQAAYREVFAEGLSEDLVRAIHDATQRGWVPGSERFRRQIEAALGRRVEPPIRGRPPKVKDNQTSSSPTASQLPLL